MREAQRARGEKPRYDGRCRMRDGPAPAGVDPVIRFRNPLEGEVAVHDLIRGTMFFSNSELDDLVIARPDGTPTYNFTVVIDDLEMQISHVIRGDDHINNTPRQLNILSALGGELPLYAHVPMILGPDGQRLSKRHGAVSVTQYREDGFLPEALLNYLVRLGWSHGDQEIFSREELCALFDVGDVNRAASVFDNEKLAWLNQHYIQESAAQTLLGPLAERFSALGVDLDDGPPLEEVVEVQRDRAKTLVEMAEKSLFAFRPLEGYDEQAARKHLRPVALESLEAVRERLASLEDWSAEGLQAAVEGAAAALDLKLGKVAQPLRVALTGTGASPGIEKTLLLVGRPRALERLDAAIEHVRERASQQG